MSPPLAGTKNLLNDKGFLLGSPNGYQLFNLTDFVNIAFCSRKAYIGEGLVPSRTGFTGDHKGRPYVSSHHAM